MSTQGPMLQTFYRCIDGQTDTDTDTYTITNYDIITPIDTYTDTLYHIVFVTIRNFHLSLTFMIKTGKLPIRMDLEETIFTKL
jgi:hypothetical protein